jgi:catechol 2,3-dioxygenase-like lactoylglutathione lyase family enzyme
MIFDLPIRQIAYFVPDIRAAACAHRRHFGSGPYVVADHIPLRLSRHRGVERPLDHSSAYGQWGPVMVEFVQQNNPGPSAFRDIYPEGSGQGGMHHVALFVADVERAMARYAAEGHETALYAEMHDGFAFAMIDMVASLGHMVELYEPLPVLTDFYAFVASAARPDPDAEPITEISFG